MALQTLDAKVSESPVKEKLVNSEKKLQRHYRSSGESLAEIPEGAQSNLRKPSAVITDSQYAVAKRGQ